MAKKLAAGKQNDSLEVSSGQLQSELIEIKEKVAALETIASLSNRSVVEKFVSENVKSLQAKRIMRACEIPKTRDELTAELDFASSQALDHHLKPLRESDLLQQRFNSGGKLTFEWSNLFKRLPKAAINKILNSAKT
jgi:hypothetical protein